MAVNAHFKRLKTELCRLYNLQCDQDIYLHFLMPLQKYYSEGAKLYVTMPCKIYIPKSDKRHFNNTGYVGKILLSLPFFVLYSMPSSGHIFLKWLLDNDKPNSANSLTSEDKACLEKFLTYKVFDFGQRSCDLTNHQPIMISRFLARTEDDVRFFRQLNKWHFLVDSQLMRTPFEDFEIQEQLNTSQAISLDTLGKCIDRIADDRGICVFNISYQAHHMSRLYMMGGEKNKKLLVLSSGGVYHPTDASVLNVSVGFTQDFPDTVFRRAVQQLWHGLFTPASRNGYPDLDSFLFISCTFDIEVGCIPADQLKIESSEPASLKRKLQDVEGNSPKKRKRDGNVEGGPVSLKLQDVEENVPKKRRQDDDVGLVSLKRKLHDELEYDTKRTKRDVEENEVNEEREEEEKEEKEEKEKKEKEKEEKEEKEKEKEERKDKFPTFLTGFVQCICFRKILYRKGFEQHRDLFFVHVPKYYKFNVTELAAMWQAKFVAEKKFWLADSQIVFFESELAMISEFLFYLFTHVDVFMGFNSMGFDLPFLISRCNFLNEKSCIASIYKSYFNSITMLCFSIPANPGQKLFLRNTSNGFSSTFFVTCKTCKQNRRDVKLDISTANDQDVVSCIECRHSQRIDKRELITQRKSTKAMSDSLALSIHFDLIKSQFVQLTCTRRNLETVINTALQESVDAKTFIYDAQQKTLTFALKTTFELNKNLAIFLQTYVVDICVAIFYFRKTSNELVRLTTDETRLVDILFETLVETDDKNALTKMSNPPIAFDHNNSEIYAQLQNLQDKKVKLSLVVSNVSDELFEQITQVSSSNALKISPGKTSGIDPYTQRNWSEASHVVETAFYCFIDTMLTAMLENNIKMYMNMYKANYLELLPGVLVYLPSGKQVLPKTLKGLISECMVFNMKTPLQCFILFNIGLKIQGVPRNLLTNTKRLPIYADRRTYDDDNIKSKVLYNKAYEAADAHALCVGEKRQTSYFANKEETIVCMRAHTTDRDIMEWRNDTWNVDESSIGIMGENSQTLESAEKALNMIRSSAQSPTKKPTLDHRFVRVTKMSF